MTIAESLEISRQDVCDSASGLTDEQAARKPAPDRWSVLDCLEHLVIVEYRFLAWLAQAGKQEAQPNSAKEAKFAAMTQDRSTKVMAPEVVHPSGQYTSVAEALAAFNEARAKSIEAAGAPVMELYALAARHPRFGDVNGTELLTIVAGHARRHAAQIRETRAALGMAAAG